MENVLKVLRKMKKSRFWVWAALAWCVVGMTAFLYLAFQPDSNVPQILPAAKPDTPSFAERAPISPDRSDPLSNLYFLAEFDDSEPPMIWLEQFESGETVEVDEQPNSQGMRLLALKVAVHSRLAVAYVECDGKVEAFRSKSVHDVAVPSNTLMPGEPEPAIPDGLTEPVIPEGLTDPVIPEGVAEPLDVDNLLDPSMPDKSAGE